MIDDTDLRGSARTQSKRVIGTVSEGSFRRLLGCGDFALEEEEKTLPLRYISSDPVSDTLARKTSKHPDPVLKLNLGTSDAEPKAL
jgi:hypothetical protein